MFGWGGMNKVFLSGGAGIDNGELSLIRWAVM
jgi:hypothetical protein